MDRIAVLTSGGDAPGMNAAIRAVVRSGISKGWDVFGVMNGYAGLIEGEIKQLKVRDVGGIIQTGGTMLGSARCLEFKTIEGQMKAIEVMKSKKIEGLVVIGGNGSQQGSFALHKLSFPVVGVASTIDNDLFGSDTTIGVDTALNIVLEAIDRLKITASSHRRGFLIETMGRDHGYLALMAGLAGGAELVVIPERDVHPEDVAKVIKEAYRKGKKHAIVVVAEGAKYNANRLSDYCAFHADRLGFKLRVTILGHVQRGGIPTAYDRILASRLGAFATDLLEKGDYGMLAGLVDNRLKATPLTEVVASKKILDPELLKLSEILD